MSAEPIGVVGIGLRLPGGSETFEQFGDFLAEGRSGIGPLPRDRWDVDAFTPDEPGQLGRIHAVGGGFLDRIARLFSVPSTTCTHSRTGRRPDPSPTPATSPKASPAHRPGTTETITV